MKAQKASAPTINSVTLSEFRDSHWPRAVSALEHAYQPIVHLNSGVTYGIEAFMRNVQAAGFDSIEACISAARSEGFERPFDFALREKALTEFANLPFAPTLKLFCNVDNYIYEDPVGLIDASIAQLRALDLPEHVLTIEVSETTDSGIFDGFEHIVADHRRAGIRVAIDDFGAGFAGLSMLYKSQPDFVKIDKLFISGIARDLRKRVFVSNIVNLARALGISVIAEGIETEADLRVCQSLGCDFGQGYFIARPTSNISDVKDHYDLQNGHGAALAKPSSNALIEAYLRDYEPLNQRATIDEVLQAFREREGASLLPVIDNSGEPVGIIREADLRTLLYNPFGMSLLHNPALAQDIRQFVTACPVIELSRCDDGFLDNYLSADGKEGLIVCQDRRYLGFLPSQGLLALAAERNLAAARDQNPLSQLPGNMAIRQHMETLCERTDIDHVLAYFDFDHFKAFNDIYGFERGDKAILMFAEQLRRFAMLDSVFAGHLGGDDFFCAFSSRSQKEGADLLASVQAEFAAQIESLYRPEDRQAGGIYARDRYGEERMFPMMTVSIGALFLPRGTQFLSSDSLTERLAEAKSTAKKQGGGIHWSNAGWASPVHDQRASLAARLG